MNISRKCKLFNRFFVVSVLLLLTSLYCDRVFVSAASKEKKIFRKNPCSQVQVQQKKIIQDLNRIEYKLRATGEEHVR